MRSWKLLTTLITSGRCMTTKNGRMVISHQKMIGYPTTNKRKIVTAIKSSSPESSLLNSEIIDSLNISFDNQIILIMVGLPGCGKSTIAEKIAVNIPVSRNTLGKALESENTETLADDFPDNNGNKANVPPTHQILAKSRRQWLIACQDVLKDRKSVIQATQQGLIMGKSVIIDRCNFDKVQRSHWIKIAWDFNNGNDLTTPVPRKKYGQQNVSNSGYSEPLSGNSGGDQPQKVNLAEKRNATNQVITLCVVLPRFDDVEFCTSRAISRGNDGIHNPSTNWTKVCRMVKHDLTTPSVREGIDAVVFCKSDNDVEVLISRLGNI